MATEHTSISPQTDPSLMRTEPSERCRLIQSKISQLQAELARLTQNDVATSNDDALAHSTDNTGTGHREPDHPAKPMLQGLDPSTNSGPKHAAWQDDEYEFRLLAEYSSDMISRHAADGSFIYVSPACRHILGREPHEIIGHNAYEFMAPQDHDHVRKGHDEQLQTAGPSNVTYRLVHPDGKVIWVESTTHCLVDADHNVTAIHVATRNVNDRVLAQQALVKSEAEYRSLIECATDIIFRLDRNYRIVYLNNALSKETRTALLGSSFFDRLEPKDHPKLQAIFETVFVHNEPVSTELKVIPVTCESHLYAFRFAPIQEQGQTVAATVIATDISHRIETDQALLLVRSAIENVQDAVMITSPELDAPGPNIIYVNPAFEKMTGYSAQEIQGKNPRILQGPKTDRRVLDRLRQHLSQGRIFHGETINYRKDGGEYFLEWDISPIHDDQGKVINFVSIQRDITELRRQEEASRFHQSELAHVGRLSTMGEMVSGLAHELNQPLTAIANYTRGCLRRLEAAPHTDPRIAQAIELAAVQADRAGQIIRRMRQFIRKRVPQHVPVAINHVVNDTVGLIECDARQYQIDLQCDLAPDLPMVKADHIQIEQVVLNLLRNAFEALAHLPANDRHVAIYTRAIKGGVRLSVLDNGGGMDETTTLRIFEPFFTTKNRGLGMGLPICQSIIESHNGLLWVDRPHNHPDKVEDRETLFPRRNGELFHLWLPQISAEDLLDSQNHIGMKDELL